MEIPAVKSSTESSRFRRCVEEHPPILENHAHRQFRDQQSERAAGNPRITLSVSNLPDTRGTGAERGADGEFASRSGTREQEVATFAQAIRRNQPRPATPGKIPRASPTTSVFRGIMVIRFLCSRGIAGGKILQRVHVGLSLRHGDTGGFSRHVEFVPMPMRRSRNVGSAHCPMGT